MQKKIHQRGHTDGKWAALKMVTNTSQRKKQIKTIYTIDICNKTLAAKNPIDGPIALSRGKLKQYKSLQELF